MKRTWIVVGAALIVLGVVGVVSYDNDDSGSEPAASATSKRENSSTTGRSTGETWARLACDYFHDAAVLVAERGADADREQFRNKLVSIDRVAGKSEDQRLRLAARALLAAFEKDDADNIAAAAGDMTGACQSYREIVTLECLRMMRQAEAAPLVAERENRQMVKTLTVCRSADEWFAALRTYPGAMGVKDASFVGDLEIQVACYKHRSTPVCLDAASEGRL